MTWCERVEALGYRAGIYTAPVYGAEWRGALARWPLWVAQYSRVGAWVPSDTDQPMKLAPWKEWAIWQFSGGGTGLDGNRVPGVDGWCDLDLVNGGLETWRGLLGLPEVDPKVDMGGPVHGTHLVEAALGNVGERGPVA